MKRRAAPAALLALLPALAALGNPTDSQPLSASSPDGGSVPPALADGGNSALVAAGREPPPRVPTPDQSPGFTQDRQFTNARLWRLDTGHYAVEQWWSGEWGTPQTLVGTNGEDDQLLQTEAELGLLPHLELDVYANVDLDQASNGAMQLSPTGLTGIGVEARVAIGRYWGQIWGNPTLDAELWGRVSEPTRLEGRLLLGGQVLTPRLLGVVNLMFARNSFHDDTIGIDYEIKADLGLNCEILRDILRLGAEATVGWDSHNAVDANNDTIVFPFAQIGPALLLTDPHKHFKLLAAVLYGLTTWDTPWTSQLIAGTSF